ncbi:glutamate ABC transporter substrate-binding protein [Streptomyces sp. MAR4 CNX-425]|uniref:glutamate ABC transporter substrate-binding protein n=1 Tax=Streptomyces sp. MAR4 CNX-425 TaxID=3406343 RepID=UPI003B515346
MNLRKVSAAAACALALSVTAAACGSDDGDSGDSGDGGSKDSITVGIKFDQPGLGLKEPDGSYSGFDVDVATYVAKELGYSADQIEWKEAISADRETMLERGDVDMIAATYSITDEREQKVDFAGPYLLAHQDLLIRSDDTIAKGADLNGKTLCSVTGSTSAQNVKDTIAPKAQLAERAGYSECLDAVANGSIDALTTDDSILAGYAAQDENKGKFKLAGLNLSNENYGIGVQKGDEKMKSDIDAALEKMVSDGSWEKFMEANLGPANYDYEPAPKIGDIKE